MSDIFFRRNWKIIRLLGVVLFLGITVSTADAGFFWDRDIVRRVPCKEKLVALTYDDGPYPVYTAKIIGILDKYHVKATFFMIGEQVKRYPELAKMVAIHGNAIGNHTYDHPHNLEKYPPPKIRAELEQCEKMIRQTTGQSPHIFRPPLGFINSTIGAVIQSKGYHSILWTVSADHHDAPTPTLMARRVLRYIRPGGIILMHDGRMKPRWKDVAATSLIIKALLKKGYRFVTVPELLKRESYQF